MFEATSTTSRPTDSKIVAMFSSDWLSLRPEALDSPPKATKYQPGSAASAETTPPKARAISSAPDFKLDFMADSADGGWRPGSHHSRAGIHVNAEFARDRRGRRRMAKAVRRSRKRPMDQFTS